MADHKEVYHETLAYFMTEYPVNSTPSKLKECIQAHLIHKYSAETIAEFLEKYFDRVRSQLIEEYNNRFDRNYCLRFKFLDDIGEKVCGIGEQLAYERVQFQDALNELDPAEFEALSAYVLKLCGCESYWKTPQSHDQGIDAFGHRLFLENRHGNWQGGPPRISFLAQAKHFKKTTVGSKDIREFVGSYSFALHQIYSTIDKRYKQLELQPFSPTALIFMTTEEVPHTVKRLSTRCGIVVLTSDDLFDLLVKSLGGQPLAVNKNWVLEKIRKVISDIPLAE